MYIYICRIIMQRIEDSAAADYEVVVGINIMLLNCTTYMYTTSLLDAVGQNGRTLIFVTKFLPK